VKFKKKKKILQTVSAVTVHRTTWE